MKVLLIGISKILCYFTTPRKKHYWFYEYHYRTLQSLQGFNWEEGMLPLQQSHLSVLNQNKFQCLKIRQTRPHITANSKSF
jgi:hypothetical protein